MKSDKPISLRTLFRGSTVKRTRDLQASGLNRVRLAASLRAGEVERVGRGLYRLPESPVSENHSLTLATKRVPRGVVCLLSALRFHEMTTQSPHETWLALPMHGWLPTVDGLPLRFVWLSAKGFNFGIEIHEIEGVPVRVYSVAKTVADCFKYRNKIGMDVALEALREVRRGKRCTMDDLMRAARVCRVANVMRPYLEALA